MRTFSGARHGYMVNFSCSGSASPRPPYRVTRQHQADGQHVVQPIIDHVLEIERNNPDRTIAVLLPELVERQWYQYFLHSQRAQILAARLLGPIGCGRMPALRRAHLLRIADLASAIRLPSRLFPPQHEKHFQDSRRSSPTRQMSARDQSWGLVQAARR